MVKYGRAQPPGIDMLSQRRAMTRSDCGMRALDAHKPSENASHAQKRTHALCA
jgi:hypothetical protein